MHFRLLSISQLSVLCGLWRDCTKQITDSMSLRVCTIYLADARMTQPRDSAVLSPRELMITGH